MDLHYIFDLVSSMYYYKVVTRILCAAIIGGIVGFEREHKNRPAGFRTHILVCVCACSLMLLSDLLFVQYYEEYGVVLDPQRIGAQVISGIGFLGAGTIIHFGNSVRGLTTAASIWSVAALGLICGSGLLFLAFFTLLVIEIVLLAFDKYSGSNVFKPKRLDIFLTIIHSPEVMGKITMFFAENNVDIAEINFKSLKGEKDIGTDNKISKVKIVLNIEKNHSNIEDLISQLEDKDGIISINY